MPLSDSFKKSYRVEGNDKLLFGRMTEQMLHSNYLS
jgi:hypothetical protein